MNIYFQGYKGAYSHKVAKKVARHYKIKDSNIIGVFSFKDIFENLKKNDIGIIPIENSYAGSIYENFYNIIDYNAKIIGEFFQDINHCLVSTGKDIKKIKKAYSHYQALMQCENYLKEKNIKSVIWGDTAGSAKYVKELNDDTTAAISSSLAAKIYGLNILDKKIQDQEGNTTRFFIVTKKEANINNFSENKKMSIVFNTKNKPSALYKCLGAFATNNINLTKIESLSTRNKHFEYMFWVDFNFNRKSSILNNVVKELSFFAKKVKILGKY